MKSLAFFRLKLLLKQKLAWGLMVAAALYIPLALFLAFSSYVRPDKIFWDLSLSFCFIMGILLSTYLGTHLFQEEHQRKTLSFVLTLRSSRREWLIGNWLGMGAMIGLSLVGWTAILSIASISAGKVPPAILFQSQLFLFYECLIALALSMLLSLFLKPLLAWFAVLGAFCLLHSKSYLEVLVVEADFSGVTKFLYDSVLFVLNFLPPLEWWDTKVYVGFQSPLDLSQFAILSALTLAWTFIFLFFAQLRMEDLDL